MIPRRIADGFWASVLQWSRLGVNALVFLVVARLLTLEEIGAFATAAAPLRFFQVIHKSGVEESVVIREPGDSGLDALFILSLAAASVVIAVSLAASLLIGRLVPDEMSIGPMLAVLSLASLAFAFGAVPDGILRRAGQFRALALRTLAAQGIAAAATVAALMAGFGPWSLVVFMLVNAALAAAISMVLAGWQTARHWPDRASLVTALRSVSALSGRVLIGAALQPILQIGVGTAAGLAAAGMFQIALRILALMEAVTLAPLRFLALPRFSRIRKDAVALQQAVLAALGVAGLFSAWVYLGVAAAAPDMLALLVGGANAAETVPVLRLLCLSGLGAAGAAVVNQALIGASLGAVAFRLSILLGIITLAFAAPVLGSVTAVAASMVASSVVVLAVMLWRMPRWFGVGGTAALRAVGLPYAAGATMALAVVGLNRWLWPDWPLLLRLGCQVATGSVIYLAVLRIVAPQTLSALRRDAAR